MMVSVGKVQQGIGDYINEEFVGKLSGLQKWGVDIAAGLLLVNAADIFNKYKDNDLVKMMGIIDSEDNIDIDKIYYRAKSAAQKGPVTFTMPIVGAVTLNEHDIERLYAHITK